jgi:hypothetical protein
MLSVKDTDWELEKFPVICGKWFTREDTEGAASRKKP